MCCPSWSHVLPHVNSRGSLMCWTFYLCFCMWADWAHWTVRKLCVGDGPFFSWWVFLVAHSTNCVGERDCTQLPPSNLLSWCKFSFDFITLHQFDPISYSLYFSNISNQWKIFRFLWPLLKLLEESLALPLEVWSVLEPHASGLCFDWWQDPLVNELGNWLSWNSGQLFLFFVWASLGTFHSLFIELEPNFFFYIHVRDCYSVFALAPGPFSSILLGSISSAWFCYWVPVCCLKLVLNRKAVMVHSES